MRPETCGWIDTTSRATIFPTASIYTGTSRATAVAVVTGAGGRSNVVCWLRPQAAANSSAARNPSRCLTPARGRTARLTRFHLKRLGADRLQLLHEAFSGMFFESALPIAASRGECNWARDSIEYKLKRTSRTTRFHR